MKENILIVKQKINNRNLIFDSTKITKKGLYASFAFDLDCFPILKWENRIVCKSIGGDELLVDFINENDFMFLSLFILSEAKGLCLFQKAYFLLHDSAVKINAKVTILLGIFGSDKSTTAAAFAIRGYSIMPDDMVGINVKSSSEIFVKPAIPQIKIWQSAAFGLWIDTKLMNSTTDGLNKFSFENEVFFERNAFR